MVRRERVLTLGTIRNYILEYFPNTLWWDGFNKHEVWNKDRSYKHRQSMPNEIRIEFDYDEDYNKNWEAINYIAIKLTHFNYSFAIFYVEGGRGPHLHIYDLDELEQLSYDQRTEYRQRFLAKLCSNKYSPDYELCEERHLCALEFVNHFKYNKPKQLLCYFWNGRNMGIDLDIKLNLLLNEIKKIRPKKEQHQLKFGDRLRQTARDKIIGNLNFETVLDKYGIKYRGHMAVCPFHNDTDGSLSFDNEKGLWKCFGAGCESKGDIITLIKMLREMKE
jgi:hypothetical protein